MTTLKWLWISTAAALLAGAETTAAQADPVNGRQRVLEASIGPLRATPGSTTVRMASVATPEAAMLHAFHVEVVDSSGTPTASPAAAWEVEIRPFGTASDCSCVDLTPGMTTVSLPQLLGLRVEAAQTVVITARVGRTGDSTETVYLRVTIEYEPVDDGLTRLAVTPAIARGLVSAARDGVTWEWRAAESGRLLALAGVALGNARELTLQDVATGTVIWRESGRGSRLAFAANNPYVRLGAMLIEGRTYRLTAIYENDSAPDGTSVIALALAPRGSL